MTSKDSIIKCGRCNSVDNTVHYIKRGYNQFNEYTCNACGHKIPTHLIPDFGLTPTQLDQRRRNAKSNPISNPKRDYEKYKQNKIRAKTEAALRRIIEMRIKVNVEKRPVRTPQKREKIDLTKVCLFKDDEIACIKNCQVCKWRVTKNTYDILSADCPFNNTEDCIRNCSGCHWQLKQNVPYEYKPLEIYP